MTDRVLPGIIAAGVALAAFLLLKGDKMKELEQELHELEIAIEHVNARKDIEKMSLRAQLVSARMLTLVLNEMRAQTRHEREQWREMGPAFEKAQSGLLERLNTIVDLLGADAAKQPDTP